MSSGLLAHFSYFIMAISHNLRHGSGYIRAKLHSLKTLSSVAKVVVRMWGQQVSFR
eukprot:TRINITY_DN4456_c0_g1_i1.p4 TRINITY_DN4456_c0_g1~~TRINITY_DN4456_c0_g1_i1.p4  ORF type:complete len:56 (-),score=0.50 TRINITY_DN4456_c0_g1_i1:313-480(-)